MIDYLSILQKDRYEWQMTYAGRCALTSILQEIMPKYALEIGTAQGGSLAVLSRFCETVFSLDCDPTCQERLSSRFPNVEFIAGYSFQTLPPLLKRVQEQSLELELALIDGDHSSHGVKQDIEYLLTLQPTQPLYILMHDSFNPDCRKGIIEARWEDNPYVHMVKVDFIPGIFHTYPDNYRQMWGGLALALLLPVKRNHHLIIEEEQQLLFQTTFAHSLHQKSISKLMKAVGTILWLKIASRMGWPIRKRNKNLHENRHN